ncbi:MAG: helical backbone metal receptor [Victivallaceae bacterium]|nr:helical backbone metal receptor [Victivallaceae bacterium]
MLIRSYIVIGLIVAGDLSAFCAERLRVISLSPSLTETIYKLGGQDKLVGRSSACDYPDAAKNIPICGDYKGPALEKLVRLKPDVVVSAMLKDKGVISNIERLGIKFYLLPAKTLSDYPLTVKKLGEILNLQQAAADEIARFTSKLRAFRIAAKKIPLAERPTVLLLIYDRPLMSVGRKSFINELITIAGGRNIAGKIERSYFNCSMEWVMKQQPQVIVMPASSPEKIAEICQRPGWRILNAIRNKRIYYQSHNDILYRLGPRVLDGIAALQKYFYPGNEETVKR